MNILEIRNVTKSYSSKIAVRGVSLAAPEGVIFGLLGPNGAGKTSMIRMITRITYPDSGEIFLLGEPLSDAHQAKIGYMPEERGLYKKMKVGEQIIYLLRLKNMTAVAATKAADEWLERLELTAWKNTKVEELSKGMQQKVQFIVTIAHKPPLLILDEPFSGLDPLNAQMIEDIIKELKSQGVTIIFSTHRMEQVEEMCDQIALINDGEVILEDTIANVRRNFRASIYTLETLEPIPAEDSPFISGLEIINRETHRITVKLNSTQNIKAILAQWNEQFTLTRFAQYAPSLKEIFIEQVERYKTKSREAVA